MRRLTLLDLVSHIAKTEGGSIVALESLDSLCRAGARASVPARHEQQHRKPFRKAGK